MSESLTLTPVAETVPEPQPVPRSRARLLLPFMGATIRVRPLAVGVSATVHALLLGALMFTRLAAPLPVPPPLVEVEFVEIAGAKGGGGSPSQAAPLATSAATAKASQAVALADPAARQASAPTQPQTPTATAPSIASISNSMASGGGSGGGGGGGQGTGSGQSVGSGTGQGGVAVDRMPVAVRKIKPVYPMDARRRGLSGQVTLRLYVDAEGDVREVQVQAAEPAGVFEEKAVEAARKWKFDPAMFKGAPVGVWMTLPVRFALDGR